MNCCDKYASAYDPESGEVACANCGTINDEETEMAAHLLTIDQQAQAQAEDHNITNGLLLSQNGSKHGYVSIKTTGLCFQLSNPRAKDFAGKRVKKPVLKDGYLIGRIMDESGGLIDKGDGTDRKKFKADYTCDKWFKLVHQRALQLCAEYELDVIASNKVIAGVKKLYSLLLIDDDMLPELFVRMVMQDLPAGIIKKDARQDNEGSLQFVWQKVNELIVPYIQKEQFKELEALLAK